MTGALLPFIEVKAPGASPALSAVLLHGILGSGSNWRSFARRLVDMPGGRHLRLILPDLRGHGDAPGGTFGPPADGPHTVGACADDLARLEQALGAPFDWVVGHSFGGKVACELAERVGHPARSLWLLDTNPAPLPGGLAARDDGDGLARVFSALDALGEGLPPREDVVAALIERGISRPTALWLGTNVRRGEDGGFRWRFSREVVRALIADYAGLDCLSRMAEGRTELSRTVVRGGRSDRFEPADLEGLDALASRGRLRVAVLPDAGHWLHVDDPDGLLALMDREALRLSGAPG
jgi:esterase